ncbi:MAG: radical SAM protein [Bacteroidales bacterium]|nr:radical SAM protein [Bacteroidales bacterium]
MLREETVFGPLHSRRLGSSLGINLLPTKGKICNFDCIYCECGWNADGRGDTVLPTAAQVRSALEDKLTALLLDGTPVDSITFSGDGEPTLNPDFPTIIDDTLKLRDAFYPGAKVSVLSNATRVHLPEVFEALRKVDNPIMKIDAPTDALAALINRPAPGYSVARTVEALKKFQGDFVLQTMFLRYPIRSGMTEEAGTTEGATAGMTEGVIPGSTGNLIFDSGAPEVLEPWMDIVRTLKPRQVQVYSIDRPTPAQDLEKYSVEEMKELVAPLLAEGYNVQFR